MSLYRIDFTSWENDADNFRTVGVFLTSEEDVHFYKDLAEKFVSGNSFGYGNDEQEPDFLEDLIKDLIEAHPHITQKIKSEWLQACEEEDVYDKLCEEILSQPVEYDYGFCRVYSSSNVLEVQPGHYLDINKKEAVFIKFENNKVFYRISSHPVDENGEVDIFKIEWKEDTCSLTDISIKSISDNVSRKVAKLR